MLCSWMRNTWLKTSNIRRFVTDFFSWLLDRKCNGINSYYTHWMCHTWLRSVGISSSIIIILYLHELHFNSKNFKIFELKHFVLGKIKKLMYNQITLNKTTQNLSYHLYENLYLPLLHDTRRRRKAAFCIFEWSEMIVIF